MKRKWFFTVFYLLIAVALLGIVTVFALDAGSLNWWTVDGGGATSSTGGSYNLAGSIGQPDAGTSTGGTYALVGGFWGVINNPPNISDITDKSTNENTATGNIAFTIGDAETPAVSLTVTATSSNTTLVPNTNITLGGTGASRTINITPASHQNGTSTITVAVNDGTATASDTFVLTVNVVNDPPTVVSSVRVNPNPTSLASVNFTVTFSEVVTGADVADFNLTLTGITGAKVTAVSGAGATRTVTVGTGAGSGTLRLNVVDNDTILDAVGNKLGGTGAGNGNYTAGQSYTIADKTPPKVISSVRVNPSLTNLASVKFTVTFSEVVTGVDAADFNLTLTGVKGAKVTAVSGSGATRTVTVSTGTGNGKLRLNVIDNDTIRDAAGNKLGGTGLRNGNYTAGQSYILDKTAPKVISSMRVNTSPTNLASVKFIVKFSEVVTGVDVADFSLTLTGVKGAKVTAVSGTGATRTVTVNTGTGNGTLRLNVIDNDTILDVARNKLGGAGLRNGNYSSGQTYTIEKTALTVDKDAPDTLIDSTPTGLSNSTSATFTFSSTDGIATFECSLDGSAYAACSSPTDFTALAEGPHSFEVRAMDSFANVDASPASFTWTIDTTAPVAISSLPVSTDPTDADSVDFIVTFSETVSGVDVSDFSFIPTEIADASIMAVSGSGTTYTVTVSTGTGSGTLRLDVVDDDTILDEVGNPLGGIGWENGNYTAVEGYTINKP